MVMVGAIAMERKTWEDVLICREEGRGVCFDFTVFALARGEGLRRY